MSGRGWLPVLDLDAGAEVGELVEAGGLHASRGEPLVVIAVREVEAEFEELLDDRPSAEPSRERGLGGEVNDEVPERRRGERVRSPCRRSEVERVVPAEVGLKSGEPLAVVD